MHTRNKVNETFIQIFIFKYFLQQDIGIFRSDVLTMVEMLNVAVWVVTNTSEERTYRLHLEGEVRIGL